MDADLVKKSAQSIHHVCNARSCIASIFLLLLGTGGAFSESSIASSRCPIAWLGVLEKIASARGKLPPRENVILFAGPDGRVFNCFDEQISKKDILEFEFLEKNIARIRREDTTGFFEGIPRSFNYVSFTDPKNPANYMFYLPYQDVELNSAECVRTIEFSLSTLGQQ